MGDEAEGEFGVRGRDLAKVLGELVGSYSETHATIRLTKDGIEVAAEEASDGITIAKIPYASGPPSFGPFPQGPYVLASGGAATLLRGLDRSGVVLLRPGVELTILPDRGRRPIRCGPAEPGESPPFPTVAGRIGLEEEILDDLLGELTGLEEGASVVAVAVGPTVGTLCVLRKGSAIHTVTFGAGAGAGLPAELHAPGRVEGAAALDPFLERLDLVDEGAIELVVLTDGGIGIRQRIGETETLWAFEPVAGVRLPPFRGESPQPSRPAPPPPSVATTRAGSPSGAEPAYLARFRTMTVGERSKIARTWEQFWPRVKAAWPDSEDLPWIVGRDDPGPAALASLASNRRALTVLWYLMAFGDAGLWLDLDRRVATCPNGHALRFPSYGEGTDSLQALLLGTGLAEREGRPTRRDTIGDIVIRGEVVRLLKDVRSDPDGPRYLARGAVAPTGATLRLEAGPHLPLAWLLARALREDLRLTTQGRVYKTDVKRIEEPFGPHAAGLADSVLDLARVLGLVEGADGIARPAEEDRLVAFFGRSADVIRRQVLDALSSREPGLVDHLCQILLDESTAAWLHPGGVLSLLEHRRRSEGRPVASSVRMTTYNVLVTQLALAGVIEFERGETSLAFRPTPDGLRLLAEIAGVPSPSSPITPRADSGPGAPPDSPESVRREGLPGRPSLHVLPSFEVTAEARALTPDDAWILCRAADVVMVDRLVTFRLTRESVAAAARAGLAHASLIPFLERRTGRPLPQNVAFSLREWGPASPRLAISLQMVVHGDPQEIDRLLAQEQMKGALQTGEIPGRAVVVGDPDRVLDAVAARSGSRRWPHRWRQLDREGPGAPGRWAMLLLSPQELRVIARATQYYGTQSGGRDVEPLMRFIRGWEAPSTAYTPTAGGGLANGRLVLRAPRPPPNPIPPGALLGPVRARQTILDPAVDAVEDTPGASGSPPVSVVPRTTRSSDPPEGDAIQEALEAAMRNQETVIMTTRTESGKEIMRTFSPYLVIERKKGSYVVGYCHTDRGLRVLRLDKVVEIEASDAPYRSPQGEEVDRFLAQAAPNGK